LPGKRPLKMGTALVLFTRRLENIAVGWESRGPYRISRDDPEYFCEDEKTSQIEITLIPLEKKSLKICIKKLGRGLFQVPLNCLSPQKIWNPYTLRNHLAQHG